MNLNTNKKNITYKNDIGKRNDGSGQSKQQFGESMFLCFMVSTFYIWSLVLLACFVQRKPVKTKMEKSLTDIKFELNNELNKRLSRYL